MTKALLATLSAALYLAGGFILWTRVSPWAVLGLFLWSWGLLIQSRLQQGDNR